jgi:hypothetical protein
MLKQILKTVVLGWIVKRFAQRGARRPAPYRR